MEKLPLPKEWYKSWDLSKASSTPGSIIDAMEQEESKAHLHVSNRSGPQSSLMALAAER